MGGNLHLLSGHVPPFHCSCEDIPQYRCGTREGSLFACCTGYRDFKEEIRHYRSHSALTHCEGCNVRDVLHLCLVQYGERTDPPSVLQRVQQCAGGVLVCLELVLLLLLGAPLMGTVVQSLPRMVLLLVAFGLSYEEFSPPLHLVQEGEVALGTAHPGASPAPCTAS